MGPGNRRPILGCQAEAVRLIADAKENAAVDRIQRLVNENCARVKEQYGMLNQTLPSALKRAGIRYLYSDYLKAWSSKSGVPLAGF